jgi:hypothetical protein
MSFYLAHVTKGQVGAAIINWLPLSIYRTSPNIFTSFAQPNRTKLGSGDPQKEETHICSMRLILRRES